MKSPIEHRHLIKLTLFLTKFDYRLVENLPILNELP